eukprot:3753403-Alexandrium_andersonii.AAC.1
MQTVRSRTTTASDPGPLRSGTPKTGAQHPKPATKPSTEPGRARSSCSELPRNSDVSACPEWLGWIKDER